LAGRNARYLRAHPLKSTPPTATVLPAESSDRGPRWMRREQIEIDGLQYEVCVTVRGGEYVGVWVCRDCGEHAASVFKNSTADQASTRAQIDLCAHHNLIHRRPRKPK
jgi:hypothetical protein